MRIKNSFLFVLLIVITSIAILLCLQAKEELFIKNIIAKQKEQFQIIYPLSKGIEAYLKQISLQLIHLSEEPGFLSLPFDPYIKTKKTQSIVNKLQQIYNKIAFQVDTIEIADHKGIIRYNVPYSRKNIGKNIRNFYNLLHTIKQYRTIIISPEVFSKDKVSLFITCPVYSKNENHRALRAIIQTKILLKHIKTLFLKPLGNPPISIVSRNKIILIHPQEQYCGKKWTSVAQTKYISDKDIFFKCSGSGFYKNLQGEKGVITYLPIAFSHDTKCDAVIIMFQKVDNIKEQVRKQWRIWIYSTIIILITSYTFFVLLYFSMKKNIRIKQEHKFQKMLLRSEKLSSMSQFSLGIAHEINNPLAIISGYIEALQRRIKRIEVFKNEDLKYFSEYLDIILSEIFRCKEICQGLLHFARNTQDEFKQIDINQIIRQTIFLLKRTAQKLRVSCEQESNATTIFLKGNSGRMRQLFFNLIKNAIEHSAGTKNARILVSSSIKGEFVVVFITDNGEGISYTNQEKIFTPFFTTKKDGKGNGLGLCIVQQVVQEHDGKIKVNSIPGNGTTFEIKLPLNEKEDL